jgi:hypothetical protein
MSESLNQLHGKARGARSSAAVPGCEFRHRPGARVFIPAGLAARRRPNPQARTPALRKNYETNPIRPSLPSPRRGKPVWSCLPEYFTLHLAYESPASCV